MNSRQLIDRNPARGELIYPLEAEADLSDEFSAGPSLAERLAVLRRHAGKIALFVVACVIVTGIYVLRQHKLYDAMAEIRVDPAAPQQLVGQNNQNQPTADDNLLMATEVNEVKSDDVIIPVINSLDLGHRSALDYTPPKAGTAPFLVAGIPHALLTAVLKSLTISRPPNTMLLDITFRARTPQLAAEVANAVATSMIRHDYETRSQSLRASSAYLTSQVQQLRAQMEQSQQKLTAYEQANEILSPDDKFNLLNQRLSTVATELDQERQAQRKLDAELRLAQVGDVDDLLATGRGTGLKPLMDALHNEQLQFAAIAAKYGAADPLYREAQRRLNGYQSAIHAATAHIATQIQDEAEAANDQVIFTQIAYDAQKKALEDYNARAAQYNLLKQQADAQTKLYDDMLARIEQADVAAGYHSNDLRIVETALPNPKAAYPKVALSLAVALLLSLLVAIGGVFLITGMDHSLSSPDTVLASTGRPLIASLPREAKPEQLHLLWGESDGLIPQRRGYGVQSGYAEAIHSLRASIFLGAAHPITTLAITSAQPREGKTTTTVSLACACGRNGQNTLLIDADMRRPEIHRALSLPNREGLSTALQGHRQLTSLIHATSVPGLSVMTAGPSVSQSAELLATSFARVLEELKPRFDLILVDCPPCLGFADAMVVAPNVDTVLILARAGSTPREFVRAAVAQMERVRADVAGVVLNAVSAQVNQYYRYYSNYTSYYRAGESESEERSHAQSAD